MYCLAIAAELTSCNKHRMSPAKSKILAIRKCASPWVEALAGTSGHLGKLSEMQTQNLSFLEQKPTFVGRRAIKTVILRHR